MIIQAPVMVKLLRFAIERAVEEGLGGSAEAMEWRRLLNATESHEVIHVNPLTDSLITDKFLVPSWGKQIDNVQPIR